MRRQKKLKPDAEIGDILEVQINPEEFGRIQAQLGRQILLGKLREAERELIYKEFEGREGELVIGYVQRYDGPNVIMDLETHGNIADRGVVACKPHTSTTSV